MGAPVSFGGADHRERLGFLADVFPVRSDVLDGVAHHQSHRAAQQRIQPPNQCDGSDGRRNLNLSLFGLCSTNHGIPLEFSSAFSMVHRLHTKCRLTSRTEEECHPTVRGVRAGESVLGAEKTVALGTGLARERRLLITGEPPKQAEDRKKPNPSACTGLAEHLLPRRHGLIQSFPKRFNYACARAMTRSLRSVISSSLDLYWWGSRTQWYLVMRSGNIAYSRCPFKMIVWTGTTVPGTTVASSCGTLLGSQCRHRPRDK